MVSLSEVQASNTRIASTIPDLVAVFVGGTNGIGEYTLKQFAKHTKNPTVYFVGRAQDAADRIKVECETLNPHGTFTFIKADTSLIRNVDTVCEEIKAKEKQINILFLTIGTLVSHTKSKEGLHIAAALAHYARARFIENLLPLLRTAPNLRRVVTVFAGTKEGVIDPDDFQGWNSSKNLIAARGRMTTLITLYLEAIGKRAPEVSFIHDFPGPVKSGIARDTTGIMWTILKVLFKILEPIAFVPVVESGERHLFFATSARYPSSTGDVNGVALSGAVGVAKGVDGKSGSGVYSIDQYGEPQSAKVEQLLAKYENEAMVDKVWDHTHAEFHRIVGEVKT